jgi:hypothetical protein
MADADQGDEGWTLEHANAIELEYRRFLYLMKKFPREAASPVVDVDVFWHYHILDTMKYAVDCEKVFGHFLHHFPYFGMRGEEDEQALERAGVRMQQLYEETFDEPYLGASSKVGVASPTDAAFCVKQDDVAADAASAGSTKNMPAYCVKTDDVAAGAASAGAMKTMPAFCVMPNDVAAGAAFAGAMQTMAAFCVKPDDVAAGAASAGTTKAMPAFCVMPDDVAAVAASPAIMNKSFSGQLSLQRPTLATA